MTEPQTVLVTGATGFIGRRLVPALVEQGHDVRAMTRDPTTTTAPGTAVGGDVFDPASLTEPLAGVDVAIYLVHSLDDPDFERKDAEAARTFARAAADGRGRRRSSTSAGSATRTATSRPTCARGARSRSCSARRASR